MGELAEIYSLNHNKALVAGLLHDAAKDIKTKEQLNLAKKAGIGRITEPCFIRIDTTDRWTAGSGGTSSA
jgi:HD superfamily phosphohydrolase YqeK